jgi:hypothetical protein
MNDCPECRQLCATLNGVLSGLIFLGIVLLIARLVPAPLMLGVICLLVGLLIVLWAVGWVVRNIRTVVIIAAMIGVTGLIIWGVASAGRPDIAVLVPTGVALAVIFVSALIGFARGAKRSLDEGRSSSIIEEQLRTQLQMLLGRPREHSSSGDEDTVELDRLK